MATPIGHSLAGYVIYHFSCGLPQTRGRLGLVLLCIVMANAPDLDFIPGLLMDRPALYHQGITHSLGFALVVSLGTAAVYRTRTKSFPAMFVLCFVSYLSHLVLDLFGPDGRLPYGIPLFWPISGERFISPVQVFLGFHHVGATSASRLEWIEGILDVYNLGAISLEIVLIAPFVFLGQRYRRGAVR